MSLFVTIAAFWGVAAIIATPFVLRLVRHARQNTSGLPSRVWDRHGDAWDLQPDGTYNLRAENADGNLQGWLLEDLLREFAPITITAPKPATDTHENGETL